MYLVNQLQNTGNLFFRYRSYFPIILFPILLYFVKNNIYSNYNSILLIVGIGVSYFGQIIRIITIAVVPPGTSGRNTKIQYASSLNTTGIYSIVRHPLYLGNYFILLGPFIYSGSIYGTIIYTFIFWMYYERIMLAEEIFLINKFKNEFNSWANKVPAFIPNFTIYKKSNGNFSFIQTIEREYTGACGILIIFSIIIIFRNSILEQQLYVSNIWIIVLIANMSLYFLFRIIKKKRRL